MYSAKFLLFAALLSLVTPTLNKKTSTVVANTKEDRELVCAINAGNPLPTFKWESQAHSCLTSACDPVEDQWKAVSQAQVWRCYIVYLKATKIQSIIVNFHKRK